MGDRGLKCNMCMIGSPSRGRRGSRAEELSKKTMVKNIPKTIEDIKTQV